MEESWISKREHLENCTFYRMREVWDTLSADETISLKKICTQTGLSSNTVRRALNALRYFDLIQKVLFIKAEKMYPMKSQKKMPPVVGYKKKAPVLRDV